MASEMRKRSCCVRDRISLLPDEILGEILSLIPTRDVVKTSTLSKRWKREWTFVPAVQLQDIHLFSGKLVSEVDKAGFMNYFEGVLNQVTFLRRLELRSSCFYDKSRLKQLIHLILAKLQNHNHNNNNVALEELDLKFAAQTVKLPPSIFTCKTLVLLKISFFVELKFPSMVCLPSLKVLHLRPSYPHWDNMKCMDVSSVENILAGCPNLEELVLDVGGPIRNRLRKERLCVKSSCLKRLTLDLDVVLRIEIEASNLEQLVLKFDMPKQSVFLITSLPLLTRARLIQCSEVGAEDKDYCGKTLIELLRKVSHTKDLFLSFNATMCLELYQQVPIFKNLVHLEAQAFSSRLPILPCLLKNCPNLVSFTLKAVGIPLLQSHSTPNCLTTTTMLHRLQKVDLSYDEACEHEMEVVTYFMKNAPVLKKMIVVFKSRTMDKKEASLLYNSILNIPKASLACEVVAKIYGSKSKIIFP